MRIYNMVFLPVIITAFIGCSYKENDTLPIKVLEKSESIIYIANKVPDFDNVVNMGQYAEAWIAPYKDKNKNLFGARKINFWIKKPSFILGETLPKRSNNSFSTSEDNHFPFQIKKSLEKKVKNYNEEKVIVNKNIIDFLKKKD